ncbi:MAG TPA: DUF6691 family protein [Polyangiaceae bacterium]
MTPAAKRNWVALACGLVFGAGLVLGGMTRPAKVLAFLDVFGAWDPSLMFVMGGALGISALAFRFSRRRAAPLAAASFSIPAKQPLDVGLLAGAALFGVGWGLGGYCPGPSVVSLASGGAGILVFMMAMLAGIGVGSRLENVGKRLDAVSSRDVANLRGGSCAS